MQARDPEVRLSFAEQMERVINCSITIAEAIMSDIELMKSFERFAAEAPYILLMHLKNRNRSRSRISSYLLPCLLLGLPHSVTTCHLRDAIFVVGRFLRLVQVAC